jgi:hypothetical protein
MPDLMIGRRHNALTPRASSFVMAQDHPLIVVMGHAKLDVSSA